MRRRKTHPIALCHPEREHQGHGLCGMCYQRAWKEARRRAGPEYDAMVRAKRRAPEQRAKVRAGHVRRTYGLANEAALREQQGGVCAICRRDRPLIVDHDHENGAARALLCRACNTLVGYLETHAADLPAAQQYLERHRFRLVRSG